MESVFNFTKEKMTKTVAALEKEYGENCFFEDAVNLLYPAAASEAVDEAKLELVAQPDVDGGLIGGASLKAEDFSIIVKAASK